MTTLYGIANCDSVKKARRWLEQQGIDYQFHDFRRDGLCREQLQQWVEELGWQSVLNRRSSSWKQLPLALREQIDEPAAIAAMLDNPTLIKRPVLDTGHQRHLGFSDQDYRRLFCQHTL